MSKPLPFDSKTSMFAHTNWRRSLENALQLRDSGHVLSAEHQTLAERLLNGEIPFEHAGHLEWYKIGRANIDWSGPQRDHQEWRAQLNRQHQILQLTWFYCVTGDESFASMAKDQILDWIAAHPTENFSMAPSDNTLNLALRVGNSCVPGWAGCLEYLKISPAFDAGTLSTINGSICAQLNYLVEQLAPIGNWRIAQADSLYFCGQLLETTKETEQWIEVGTEVINDASSRQILPDGAHCERNPHYHTWMTALLLNYWLLSLNESSCKIQIEENTIRKMLHYACESCGPDGLESGLHDTHQTAQADMEKTTSFPVTARMDSRDLLKAFSVATGTDFKEQLRLDAFFPDAGQAFVRDNWQSDASYVAFDATNWGGAHCHLSRNGFELFSHGQRMIRDMGIFSYEMNDPMIGYGKSTPAHNTVNLNGWNQGFANPQNTWFAADHDRALISSEYAGGYWSGTYRWSFDQGIGEGLNALHHRTLYWHKNRFIVIIDSIQRQPKTMPETDPIFLESNFQLEQCELEINHKQRKARARFGQSELDVYLVDAPENTCLLEYRGSQNPERGWQPTSNGIQPAPMLSFRVDPVNSDTIDLVTVLVPSAKTPAPELTSRFWHPQSDRPSVLDLTWSDGSEDRLEWTYRCAEDLGKSSLGSIQAPFAHSFQPIDSPSELFGMKNGQVSELTDINSKKG